MIERINLVNFKNHAETPIELGRLTALIGPNSSGKTNVLQAIRLVDQVISLLADGKSLNDVPFDAYERYKQGYFLVFVGSSSIDKDAGWSFAFGTSPLHFAWSWNGEHEEYSPDEGLIQDRREVFESIEQVLGHTVYFKAFDKNLMAPSYSESIPPRVESDGSGIASTVAYFKSYEEKLFSGLLTSLQSIVPSIENIRARPARVRIKEKQVFKIDDEVIPHDKEREVMGHELVFDMTGAKDVPAHSVSEGTLLALALLTLLWSPDCPNLVLLDDIEQGLHPKAQRELIAQLRKILEQRPELQIVLTSHSPYIVDELEPEEVWLLAADDEGIAHARRLSDHPEADEWLKILSTGEFWDAEGEEWILEHGK